MCAPSLSVHQFPHLQLAIINPHKPSSNSQSQCHIFCVSIHLFLISYLYFITPQISKILLEQGDYLLIFKTFTTFSEIHISIYSFIKNSTSEKCQDCEISHSTLWNANIKTSYALCIPIFFNQVQLSWILCLYFNKDQKMWSLPEILLHLSSWECAQ